MRAAGSRVPPRPALPRVRRRSGLPPTSSLPWPAAARLTPSPQVSQSWHLSLRFPRRLQPQGDVCDHVRGRPDHSLGQQHGAGPHSGAATPARRPSSARLAHHHSAATIPHTYTSSPAADCPAERPRDVLPRPRSPLPHALPRGAPAQLQPPTSRRVAPRSPRAPHAARPGGAAPLYPPGGGGRGRRLGARGALRGGAGPVGERRDAQRRAAVAVRGGRALRCALPSLPHPSPAASRLL